MAKQWMNLNKLLKNYKPIYPKPCTWDNTKNYLLNNPIEKDTIDSIIESYKKLQHFTNPIIIDNKNKTVDNGTHRVIAASLMGLTYIPYIDNNAYETSVETDEDYTTIITLKEADENTKDILFDILRSVKLDNHHIWIESVIMFQGTTLELIWDNYDPAFIKDTTLITESVHVKINKFMPNLQYDMKTLVTVDENPF